jgi:hypothetical protein
MNLSNLEEQVKAGGSVEKEYEDHVRPPGHTIGILLVKHVKHL